jgi:uracil-DNA glycosylase family 4
MDPELSSELSEIARAIRAQLEWQLASGSVGLPRSTPADLARAAPESTVAAALDAPGERVEPAQPRAEAQQPSAPVAPRESASSAPSRIDAVMLAKPAPPAAIAAPPAVIPVDLEARARRLEVLADEARACTRCALHVERKQAVFARGTGSSGLCFVGEGPGADEDEQGFPFVGAAGQLLDRMIEAMGLSRDEVYVCNIVKCRPPKNRKPEPEEMASCVPYLEEQLGLIAPQVVVALGATAVQGLLGTSEGITRLRGKWKLYRGRIPVMPTFHPAYLLRTPGAKREVWDDLQAVLRQMGRALPERRK